MQIPFTANNYREFHLYDVDRTYDPYRAPGVEGFLSLSLWFVVSFLVFTACMNKKCMETKWLKTICSVVFLLLQKIKMPVPKTFSKKCVSRMH